MQVLRRIICTPVWSPCRREWQWPWCPLSSLCAHHSTQARGGSKSLGTKNVALPLKSNYLLYDHCIFVPFPAKPSVCLEPERAVPGPQNTSGTCQTIHAGDQRPSYCNVCNVCCCKIKTFGLIHTPARGISPTNLPLHNNYRSYNLTWRGLVSLVL